MALSGLTDLAGRVLADRYRLLAPIGSGGSGRVYVADDVRLRRRVAVKVLHGALADDAGFLRRFRAEAQLAASLQHPNVVTVFDWGEEAVPFMVLELLAGGSLRGMLDEGIRLTPAQAAHTGRYVATALSYAHSRGLVHRDVKPANLLFDEHGTVRVADFGLARALAEASWTEPTGALVGTARYAAPEQGTGATLDARADLYALGVVLIESVTGRVTRPVTDSMSTTPSAYRSARASSVAPVPCSGAAYRAVPTSAPVGSVQLASASARARPKSATRTVPCSSNSRFAGLTSRWTSPRECAYESAVATYRPVCAACAGVSRMPSSSMPRRLPPDRSSRTMNGTASSPQSKTVTTFGCCSEAASWASARKRRRNPASSASAPCSTFTATRRRRRTSSATYTRPLPPEPIGASSRYRSASTRPARSVRPLNAMSVHGTERARRFRGTPDG